MEKPGAGQIRAPSIPEAMKVSPWLLGAVAAAGLAGAAFFLVAWWQPGRLGLPDNPGGTGKAVLTEPQALLTEASKLPGLDGAKMSKSYNNAIAMREDKASIETKVRRMPTDPARVKRTDAGNPDRCPVWQFHLVYSPETTKTWVKTECTRAGIGCLECKQPIIDAIVAEQVPMLARAEPFVSNPRLVRDIVDAGTQRARATAQETMRDVREAMGLNY